MLCQFELAGGGGHGIALLVAGVLITAYFNNLSNAFIDKILS